MVPGIVVVPEVCFFDGTPVGVMVSKSSLDECVVFGVALVTVAIAFATGITNAYVIAAGVDVGPVVDSKKLLLKVSFYDSNSSSLLRQVPFILVHRPALPFLLLALSWDISFLQGFPVPRPALTLSGRSCHLLYCLPISNHFFVLCYSI